MAMLTLIRSLELKDSDSHISVSADGRRVAICPTSGKCELFDSDLTRLDEVKLGAGVLWVRLDETGARMLVGFSEHTDVYSLVGSISRKLTLPLATDSLSLDFMADQEDTLCIAADERKLTAWELAAGAKVAETTLPARRWAVGHLLRAHPEGEALAVIAYSGQGEEVMFWAHYARGNLRVIPQPEIENVAFPYFHSSGGEFVSVHERLGLCRMRFPSGELLGSVTPEQAFDGSEDWFSHTVHFLRDDRFLVWQQDLALYEFDLATLRPTATVLSGVEGQTFGQGVFFSNQSCPLANRRLLTSDIRYDRRFMSRTMKRTLTLRVWDASELCGPRSSPDPARPYTAKLLSSG